MAVARGALPEPADFAPPPSPEQLAAWDEADRVARPARLARLRARFAEAGVDAYFGLRREHMRYLTGFTLAEGEEQSAGNSGQFLVTADETVVLADSRYRLQAQRQAPEWRIAEAYRDLPTRWPDLLAAVGAKRVAVEADVISHADWERLAAAAPDVELVPAGAWLATDRATKEPAELERVAAACAVADRALAALLPRIKPGVTEAELAIDLEWLMRTNGAEALAFDVACLAGPEAALPHGSPGDRPVLDRAVLLFDFGAQVAGYRSDMTRTLFVGEPTARDLAIYELVATAQSAAIAALESGVAAAAAEGAPLPSGREIDRAARDVIEAAGHGEHFGHSLGHGIGLATHEGPSLGRRAPDTPLPRRTVFSVEPGIYLDGETGVRIEDLVAIDADAGTVRTADAIPERGPGRRRLSPVCYDFRPSITASSAGARPTIAAPSPADHQEFQHMISTGELRKGVAIELDGELWQILDYHHIKMGRGSAQVRITLRNIKRGQTVERSFQAGTKWPRASMEKRPVQFLYRDGDDFHFMQNDTYDQFVLSAAQLDDAVNYLKDGMTLDRTSYQGETIGVELPINVDLEVTETEPGFAGDTQSGARKPATTETGLVVQVPIFVEQGDTIRVDTRTGEYQTRV